MGAEWRHTGVPVADAVVGERIGESWAHRCTDFARDGFVLSEGPVLPPDVVARARASFERIVASADRGEYPVHSVDALSSNAPHVQLGADGRSQMGAGGFGLRKVEMPQLERREDGIVELMNHPALADWCAKVTGADWLQVWWIQLHGKPPAASGATEGRGDGTSIGFHQDKLCAIVTTALFPLCPAGPVKHKQRQGSPVVVRPLQLLE